jgi:Leucine-rich repeat (LRR) protein
VREELPATIGNLQSLTVLAISGNRLSGTCLVEPVDLASVLTHISALPESIAQLSSLKFLELRNNKLTGILFLVFLYVQLS